MARLQTVLTPGEVETVASEVLADRFAAFGFKALKVEEAENIEGAAILRMIAEVQTRIPASELLDTLVALKDVLEGRGEDRVVLLSTHVPGADEPQQDDEG